MRYNEQDIFHGLLVAWRRFTVNENTCEYYFIMAVDVPELMMKFMDFYDNRGDRIIQPRRPEWHMRLAVDPCKVSDKPCFWYCFARCIFCIRDGVFIDL
jgi:hypothetical protein